MRVLLSPRASALPAGGEVARALAGDGGFVVELARSGVRNLGRRQSQAEIHTIRKALLGLGHAEELRPRDPGDTVVGYVCVGRQVGTPPSAGGRTDEADGVSGIGLIAVADHANLTWMSPLVGPNEEVLGPRFPVTAGLYEVRAATDRIAAEQGVVAGVWDDSALTEFETRVVSGGSPTGGPEFSAVSAELTPVAILAAHLGFRLAAVVATIPEW